MTHLELGTLLGKTGTAKSSINPAGLYTGKVVQVHIDGFIWISPENHNYQVACDADTFHEHIEEQPDPEIGHAEYLKESGSLKSFDIK